MGSANDTRQLFNSDLSIMDPGDTKTIAFDKWGAVCEITTEDTETRTLAAPSKSGAIAVICLTVDGGDLTLTVTNGYNQAADTEIVFGTAGDIVWFYSVDIGGTLYWRVINHEGTNLTETGGGTFTTVTATTLTATTISKPAAAAAEHGAGAIGTGVAPTTTRYTRDGVIITEIAVDLTGLASVATANDIIGLAAGGAAYIGRNVVATNGIIFKVEMICLEVPAGGDTDIDFVSGSADDDAYNDAVTNAAIEVNGGTWAAGTVVQTLLPAITANYYYYLTTGAGATAATYTGGQFIIRTYGHALLS